MFLSCSYFPRQGHYSLHHNLCRVLYVVGWHTGLTWTTNSSTYRSRRIGNTLDGSKSWSKLIKVNNTKLNVSTFFFPRRYQCVIYIYISTWANLRIYIYRVMVTGCPLQPYVRELHFLHISMWNILPSFTLLVHLIQWRLGCTGASVDFVHAICPQCSAGLGGEFR